MSVDATVLRERLAARPAGWWRNHAFAGSLGLLAGTLALIVAVASVGLSLGPRLLRPAWPAAAPFQIPPHLMVVAPVASPAPAVSGAPSGSGMRGRLVQPNTLADVPDTPTFNLGEHYVSALSPNGRLLAIVRWPTNGTMRGGELHLVDLSSAEDRDTGVRIDGDVSALNFVANASALIWLQARTPPYSDWQLMRYRIGGAVTRVATLPAGYSPWESRLLPTGDLVLLVSTAGSTAYTQGTPHVVFLDGGGQLRNDLALPTVLVGQRPLPDGTYRDDRPGLAWDLRDGWLYIAHAEADVVTVIDLARRAISSEIDARPRASAWQQVLGIGIAVAKLQPGNTRAAALSADGSRLYVVGSRQEIVGSGSAAVYRRSPLGGFVLDTGQRTRLGDISLAVDGVWAASDGRLLFAGSREEEVSNQPGTSRTEILVTDLALTVAARAVLPDGSTVIGPSRDGTRVYFSTWNSAASTVTSLRLGDLGQARTVPGQWLDP